ncbi:hypothetical protein R5R35_006613 [Gryllus longicercus]|uniref:Uncharacterized protein n=1 Tax=Gryllus longicercus TaxID=2509291 RepID=A0AAN9W3X0_9ORTH
MEDLWQHTQKQWLKNLLLAYKTPPAPPPPLGATTVLPGGRAAAQQQPLPPAPPPLARPCVAGGKPRRTRPAPPTLPATPTPRRAARAPSRTAPARSHPRAPYARARRPWGVRCGTALATAARACPSLRTHGPPSARASERPWFAPRSMPGRWSSAMSLRRRGTRVRSGSAPAPSLAFRVRDLQLVQKLARSSRISSGCRRAEFSTHRSLQLCVIIQLRVAERITKLPFSSPFTCSPKIRRNCFVFEVQIKSVFTLHLTVQYPMLMVPSTIVMQ